MGHVVGVNYKKGYNVYEALNDLKMDMSESNDFLSSYEQENIAYRMDLGEEIKIVGYPKQKNTKVEFKKAMDLAEYDKTPLRTDTANYLVYSKEGYYKLKPTEVYKSKTRGKEYTIYVIEPGYSRKGYLGRVYSKSEFEDIVKKYYTGSMIALKVNNGHKIIIENENGVIVSKYSLVGKYYDNKPSITKTSLVVPSYTYIFSYDAYLG